MSIFSKVWGAVEGAAESVANLAKRVFSAVGSLWGFLTHVGGILNGAWDWMVNGVTWFTSQVSDWAASVYSTLWHTLTNVIPGAVTWAFRQATKWAAGAIHSVEGFLRGLIKNVVGWARRELGKLTATVKGWVNSILHFVTGPVRWVLNTGRHIANLVLHPKALAEWVVGALIVPLILWVLRSSAPVVVWLIRSVIQRDAEIAHVIEDVLAKVI